MKPSKVYNPQKTENKIYRFWQKLGFFNPDKLPKSHRKPFVIMLPPPNITGSLHMGHALNAIVQDILIRKKRMEGFKTLWLPGTDHAGIATQNVVERELKKEGKSRFDLGREEFLKRVWQWKKKYGNLILEQLKKIGSSCDWSRTKFTMDKDYYLAVQTAFLEYFKKGWIYKGERVVNWCPRCQTSLSDLELEYKEEKGKLWYIKYPLVKNSKSKIPNFIIIATTRPETMLGDTAVAVNPKDKRYKKLIGKKVILPLLEREIPIISDSAVDPKFGTGAIKVTPAHDLLDYEISQRHKLEIIQVIDEKGEITDKAPLSYQKLKTIEARQKIIEDLKKAEYLEKTEDYNFRIPKCHRCQTTIEFILSKQWFLKMKELAKLAEKPVRERKIKFFPKRFEKPYFEWLKNIKDWCISRQIWWGHRIPVWQCQSDKMSNVKCQMSNVNEKYFISLKKPRKCQICQKCQPKQVEDVLDTWFSSALWPLATLGWPKKVKSDLKRFYPTDVLSTARDIINLWVARMISSGMFFLKKIPFKKVYIHATVLTREGKRMSKSLGTGVDPMELIEKYGADATRFGICFQIMGGQDIKFSEDNILMGKKFCNKIWNATRFILLQIPNVKFQMSNKLLKIPNSKLTKADKKILNQLKKTIKSVNQDLENFRFGQAAHTLYNFFWHNFCDQYIEEAKKQIKKEVENNGDRNHFPPSKTKRVLLYVLFNSLKLLHPFLPFITEKIYQKLPSKGKKKSIMIEKWPK
jgi:valyl-tRNA synthetase